jgi:hypothetical protein
MSTLAPQFKDALSAIQPGDDAVHAQEAHNAVSEVLEKDEKLEKLGASAVLIGSYARKVSIRRVKDVDVFLRLKEADSSTRPGATIDHVVEVLEDGFPGQVERQHRSVKVDFPDYDLSVDVVIARPCVDHPDEHWQIPQRIEDDGSARWIETNPTEMTRLSTEANARYVLGAGSTKGVYVPIVKLMRQIRRTWLDDHPGGYYIEVLTWHAFEREQPEEGTYADYLTVILRSVADDLPNYRSGGPADPTMEDKTISTSATSDDIDAAADKLAEAAALAESALADDDACSSAKKWQSLLGQTHHVEDPDWVFPMPSYCTADGRMKVDSTTRTAGATFVPAGEDRYA